MSDAENKEALDTYAEGSAKGNSSIFYSVLDDSFTFSGMPDTEPVHKEGYMTFWAEFRASVEAGGGPKIGSTDFMNFKNVIFLGISTSM